MKSILFFWGIVACAAASVFGADNGAEVFVVFNSRVPESKGVAEHYAAMRNVPSEQVLGLDMPSSEQISREDFRERLQKPLTKALEARGLIHFATVVDPATNGQPRRIGFSIDQAKVRYILLCYGVPLTILRDTDLRETNAEQLRPELRRNEAAVDNELACLPVLDQMMLAGPRANALYGCTNAQQLSPTNGIFMVARLDGPSADIARGLVDKAIEAEKNGLWGRGYFDARGLKDGPYKLGDDWICHSAEVCRQLGFDTVLDTNPGCFPATFPMSQIAFYAGWYDLNASGPFARPKVEFMPGAFAYHLHSYSAATLRSVSRNWVGPFLERGVTATMGTVDEPYLQGTPNIGIFFERFIDSHFSFGEAAYACQNYLSWQTTVVGDPLYRPFGRQPKELLGNLAQRNNKNLQWANVWLANEKLLRGQKLQTVTEDLERLDMTRKSAVLQEKLAELYRQEGKPLRSAQALQESLSLDPSPQQRVRVMLTLGERLTALGHNDEAYQVYQHFLAQCPDYADPVAIYRDLLNLAQKLHHTADVVKYQREIAAMSQTGFPSAKGPPPRHGI